MLSTWAYGLDGLAPDLHELFFHQRSWELQGAQALGITVSQFRFMLSFFVSVLVGVLFWWFLWGIPGAFIAVPIIATLKILADRTEGLEAVGEFLGE